LKTKYYLQLVALSALWGASFLLIRIASPLLGPDVLAALRIAMASVTLTLLMRVMKHSWPRQHWRELALLGFLSVAAPFVLFAWAALHLPAGYSALLNSTAVMFGILASALLLARGGERCMDRPPPEDFPESFLEKAPLINQT
jgi:drug/metabolite transporter (DMT)-like permease